MIDSSSFGGVELMDAGEIIARWKQRLTTLANQPDYVFRDTPQYLIEKHYRRLTTFVGYSEKEVAEAESRLKVHFPEVFRNYLLEMAKAPGELFRGSNVAGIADFEQYRADALELMAETDLALTLPPEAVVFMSHQGYTFVYLLALGGFDSSPLQWTETHREPRVIADTFKDMIDAELLLMESNNRECRERGGYYLTLRPEGGTARSYPSLASGERPLDQAPAQTGTSRSCTSSGLVSGKRPIDQAFEKKPWWKFWQ